MRIRHPLRLLCLVALVLLPLAARGDAIMVTRAATATTIAEVFIRDGSILVQLEIGVRDAGVFHNVIPEAIHRRMGTDDLSIEERHRRFFREDLVVRVDDRPPLTGRVLSSEIKPRVLRDIVTGAPLPTAEDDPELVIYVELEYPLPSRPATLTLEPPAAEAGGPRAEIGFVVYHLGVAVTDFRYLGSRETLDLDWQDPWYSRFRNRNLRRQYDAPVMTFLYVEPFEVRHEIVLRPMDLQRWVDLGLAGVSTIPVADQEEVKRRVAEFFVEHDRVEIDGQLVPPTLDRIHFIWRTLRKSGVIDPPEELPLTSATLGLIFVYPTSGLPQQVDLTWDLFDERITVVPAVATDEAGGLPYVLRPDDPVMRWENFLKNPRSTELVRLEPPPRSAGWGLWLGLASGASLLMLGLSQIGPLKRGRKPGKAVLGLALLLAAGAVLPLLGVGRSTLRNDQPQQIVGGLLRNIYRAFDYRDESAIYDILERSASGELLTEVYLETRRSLELENQGGARAKVKEVELLATDWQPLAGGPAFVARCTWNVAGSVGHWGHVHQRINQYEARLTVTPIDGQWKITELELLQEQRL